MRVNTSTLVAEQTLTRDGASVTVDTIVYWRVVDAGRAAIQVANFREAVLGAAQGAIRDIIGRSDLATLLSQRRELDEQLTVILDEQTEAWGVKVQSVQIRDIKVPDNLQDALSRMAQAERERQARAILGESEVTVARSFAEAGELYQQNPTALHLRGMNMLYETMRTGVASVIVVPSSALDSMNLGMIGGIRGIAEHALAEPPHPPAQPPTAPTPPAPRQSYDAGETQRIDLRRPFGQQ
jgi:regulator of protease activity HflC (stomatin/prohibitin superfamily)